MSSTIRGFMLKPGQITGTFGAKRRFFDLVGHGLFYYAAEEDSNLGEQKGTFHVA
jgi:hypothetical protein